jgi:hypothetical protein
MKVEKAVQAQTTKSEFKGKRRLDLRSAGLLTVSAAAFYTASDAQRR